MKKIVAALALSATGILAWQAHGQQTAPAATAPQQNQAQQTTPQQSVPQPPPGQLSPQTGMLMSAATFAVVSDASQAYTARCAGCHGTDLAGGRGPSLFNTELLGARTDAQLRDTIQNGVSGSDMPAFKDRLTEAQTNQIIAFLRVESDLMKGAPVFVNNPDNKVIDSQKQKFRIEVLASGLETPSAAAFLPDGRLLLTERVGRLRILDHGKMLPEAVKGLPPIWVRQDGGLLEVAVHPDYARNGWIYIAYSEIVPGYAGPPAPPQGQVSNNPLPPSMTVIARGRISAGNEWVDQQILYRAPPSLYTSAVIHYGTRFLFDGKGHMFYSLGDRGDKRNAQNLGTPLGKIHRINDDGTVPADNPFVHTPGAIPTIWSYGHRNPQGLAVDPVSGLMWESEHGPTGGDEVNIIEKGKNYGWGVITMGLEPGIDKQHQAGMEDPLAYYSPSIAPSGMSFYTGDKYPGWKNNLFLAGLVGQRIVRFETDGHRIVTQENLYEHLRRTRTVIQGPDGLLYVLMQQPTGIGGPAGGGTGPGNPAFDAAPGLVARLVPVP